MQQYKSCISMSPGHPLGTGAGLRPASSDPLIEVRAGPEIVPMEPDIDRVPVGNAVVTSPKT